MTIPGEQDAVECPRLQIGATNQEACRADIAPHERVIRSHLQQDAIKVLAPAPVARVRLGEIRMAANIDLFFPIDWPLQQVAEAGFAAARSPARPGLIDAPVVAPRLHRACEKNGRSGKAAWINMQTHNIHALVLPRWLPVRTAARLWSSQRNPA